MARQKYSKRDLKSWSTIPHSHFVRIGTLTEWTQWMGNVDFVADWQRSDSLVGQVLLANTWPELLAPKLFERLENSVSSLERQLGKKLNIRIALVAVGEATDGASPIHTCFMFDHDGISYVGPQLHSQDKRVMLSKRSERDKAAIVAIDLAAVLKPKDSAGNDVVIGGIAMALPKLGPNSPTDRVLLDPGIPDVVTGKRASTMSPGMTFYTLARSDQGDRFSEAVWNICERLEVLVEEIGKDALMMNAELRDERDKLRDSAMEQRVAAQFQTFDLALD